MADTPTRAERLGLEPGSIDPLWEGVDQALKPAPPTRDEIAHSIAISLKRIADDLNLIAGGNIAIRTQNEF